MMAMAEVLIESGKEKTLICTGVLGEYLHRCRSSTESFCTGGGDGKPFTELDPPVRQTPRVATEAQMIELSKRGLRVIVIRLPPSVHGENDWALLHLMIEHAKKKQSAGL